MAKIRLLESHSFAGCQFPGRKGIAEIMNELERQKKARKDYVTSSKNLTMKIIDKQLLLETPIGNGERMLLPCTRGVFTQISQDMGIRQTDRYYKWLTVGAQDSKGDKSADITKNWKTWVHIINDYWRTEAEGKQIRIMANDKNEPYCRAILSDKFRIIDNSDFFWAVADKCKEIGAEIWHARLSEDKFYGYAVTPGIAGQVTLDRTFDPGDGWRSRWHGEAGDVCNAAMSFSNSETGRGGVSIAKAILRRVCENYNVWHDVVAKTHIGKRIELDTVLSAETLRKQNEVFFLEIADHVQSVFDPVKFQEMIELMNGATQDAVEDVEVAVEALSICYELGEQRKNALREHFIMNSDRSRYGLANAVTQIAHTDTKLDADKGFELECLGTDILETTMASIYRRAKDKKAEKKEDVNVGV